MESGFCRAHDQAREIADGMESTGPAVRNLDALVRLIGKVQRALLMGQIHPTRTRAFTELARLQAEVLARVESSVPTVVGRGVGRPRATLDEALRQLTKDSAQPPAGMQ